MDDAGQMEHRMDEYNTQVYARWMTCESVRLSFTWDCRRGPEHLKMRGSWDALMGQLHACHHPAARCSEGVGELSRASSSTISL